MEKENETSDLFKDTGSQNLINQVETAKKKKEENIAPQSSLTQTYSVDDFKLEELMEKYKAELNALRYVGKDKDSDTLDKLNKKLFNDITEISTLLPISQVNTIPNGTYISDLEGKSDITYSRIGEENGNSLIMAETKDGQIYFDEKERGNNKFTGVVFVDRVDPNTGKLLDSKDIIRYKDGQVVDFIEGIGGNSRLGQIEQFKELASKFRTMESTQQIKEELQETVARREAQNQDWSTGIHQQEQGVGPDECPPLPPRDDSQDVSIQQQGGSKTQSSQSELADRASRLTAGYKNMNPQELDNYVQQKVVEHNVSSNSMTAAAEKMQRARFGKDIEERIN
ncbi:MAG: hypothetical protein AB8U25_03240, partial [Rickettsiales endosymbiont of Dermacentor nuttalli]